MAVYAHQPWVTTRLAKPWEDAIPLLKLHGSVNWATVDRDVERLLDIVGDLEVRDEKNMVPLIDRIEMKDVWQKDYIILYESYEKARGLSASPLLAPPTAQKVLTGGLSGVWDAAVEALRGATRIIVVGYSLPLTDHHFRYLMAAGLRDNISLRKIFFVNPALKNDQERKTLEDRLFGEERLFGTSGLFRPEHEEHGVIELIPIDTHAFLSSLPFDPMQQPQHSYRERIGRPLNPASYTAATAPFALYPQGSASIVWV
jgi:hypothetical protein